MNIVKYYKMSHTTHMSAHVVEGYVLCIHHGALKYIHVIDVDLHTLRP